MPELVVTSATFDLKPSPEWTWATPPGPPSISIPSPSAADSAWKVGGLSGILPHHLAAAIPPAPISFDFSPGKAGTLKLTEIAVTEATLATALKQEGQGFLLKTSTGIFRAIVVTPALNGTTIVGPSAGGLLSGSWSIAEAGQTVVTAG